MTHDSDTLCCGLAAGKGVTIYVLDSGIRASHQEFQPWEGSATRVTVGPDFVDDDAAADDCDGHGTHVASTGELEACGLPGSAHFRNSFPSCCGSGCP